MSEGYEEDQPPSLRIAADIQAILTFLGGRDYEHGRANHYLDLSYTDIRNADLRDANLRGAILRGADLRGAKLHSANLSHTDLRNANLAGRISGR